MKSVIILCGLPGVGKSEAGKALSQLLNWNYLDTDICLEHFYSSRGVTLSCRQIYAKLGEVDFRKLENEMLVHTCLEMENTILSIGGGTLNEPANSRFLKSIGRIVYLQNERETIFERLTRKGMPAYLDPLNPRESFEELANMRENIYKLAADFTIDTRSKTPLEIAAEIINVLKVKDQSSESKIY